MLATGDRGRPLGAATARRQRCAAACALALSLAGRGAAAEGDPYLSYWTIETPHFRVHYAKDIEPEAERVADLAEAVNRRLAPLLGHEPSDFTHIVLTDNTESANGSATALPYNTIRLYVTAPDDMSALNEYEDWYLELVSHEYTHILHTDNIGGAPSVVNAVLGKTYAPNQAQPRWVLEGLAVLEESKNTAGGRNRSSIFDMYLRADVLEDNLATLDQMCNLPRRWPNGNIWYLYGSRFLTWIVDTYGEHTMRAIADDYGRQLIPYGINRSIRRATGRTYEELYVAWVASLRRLYADQLAALTGAPGGVREGARLTHAGREAARPRFLPPRDRRQPGVPEVVYYSDDAHRRAGFYRVPLPSPVRADEGERDLFFRVLGQPNSVSFDRAGNTYLSSTEFHKNVYPFGDLSRVPAGLDSSDGDESYRTRLSFGLRAIDPDVRPDGRQVAFTINRHGTEYLGVAGLDDEGALVDPHALLPSARYQLAQTPRYSPDGRTIAYSSWSAGGFRDIRLVDVVTGAITELTHDRAQDMQPSWSPDGKTLYFSSDRTGIYNVYAFDLETRRLWQVTNVRGGAFMPEIAPDGRSMVYVGYTSAGFDLYGMSIDRARFVRAAPYVDNHPPPLPEPPHHAWPRHAYNALPTLYPRNWTAMYGPGAFGQTLVVSTQGSDAIGLHGLAASVSVDTVRADPQFSLSYSYGRLPFDLTTQFFRAVSPLLNQYRIGDAQPPITEETLGWSNYLTYSVPRAFDVFTYQLGYTVARTQDALPVPAGLDPQSLTTVRPAGTGFLGVVRGAFGYSNTESYTYSEGGSRGFNAQVTAELASKETGSQYDLQSFGYSITKYLQMPFNPDQTLLMHAQSAILGGTYPRRGAYYVGGFVDMAPLDQFRNNVFQGGFVLRGYPPGAYAGQQYHLGTVEYRAPLWDIDRGLSTLPGYLNRVSAALFLDYGGAFDTIDVRHWRDQFHTGYGAELLIDTTLGYLIGTTARLGYARGTSAEAYPGGKVYFIFAMPY